MKALLCLATLGILCSLGYTCDYGTFKTADSGNKWTIPAYYSACKLFLFVVYVNSFNLMCACAVVFTKIVQAVNFIHNGYNNYYL